MNYPEDHYSVLQVDPGAEPEVIEAAYRALARKHHPDRNPNPGAHELMAALNEAYSILRNPATRATYDRSRPVRHAPTPVVAQRYQVAVPERPARHEGGRSVSFFLLIPLFVLAAAAVAILVAFGPLGDAEIDRTPGANSTSATRETERMARSTPTPAEPTPTSLPAVLALRNSLLRAGGYVGLSERTADVTGDAVAELIVVARPRACGNPCTDRHVLVLASDQRYWQFPDLDNAELATISLSPPGFEVLQPLDLGGDHPTTGRVTFYRWTGEEFAVNGVYFEALDVEELAPEDVVRRFYGSVGREGLLQAYALLSRAYQQRHPFESWADGFAENTTVRIDSLERQADNVVAVAFTTIEGGAGAGAGTRFAGVWHMIETRNGWRLDAGDIEAAN